MSTITPPASGLTHIDALLGGVPNWHGFFASTNTIKYSFSIADGQALGVTGQIAFNDVQKANVRTALKYVSEVTGIKFTEVSSGAVASLHLSGMDLTAKGNATSEERYSVHPESHGQRELHGYVYLDTPDFSEESATLAPGTEGYERLLQELGHLLGLKHPDEGTVLMPSNWDSTRYTVMSKQQDVSYRTTFGSLDLAALAWLHGKDGLGGAFGLGAPALELTGINRDESLVGGSGDDLITLGTGDDTVSGGAGTDTVVLPMAWPVSSISQNSVSVVLTHDGSTDIFIDVEKFKFTNGTLSKAELFGTAIIGSAANDKLTAAGGNTVIDGGAGVDVVSFPAVRANYQVRQLAGNGGALTVTDTVGVGGVDTLVGVERLKFSDYALALDINGHAGQAFRLYRAAFGRDADHSGLGFWISQLDKGVSTTTVADGFLRSTEFLTVYGSSATTATFVGKLYQHILHREGDKAGIDFWVDAIDKHGVSRATALAEFAEQPEHVAQVIGTIQDGIAYTVWG